MKSLSGSYIGRYHLLEQIGEGGMATVYQAFDMESDKDVAVKFIRPDRYSSEETDVTVRRFQREASLLSKLSHPNILTLLDSGKFEDQLYLVTNFIPGISLKSLLGKPMPWQEAVRLLLPIARAMEYAHSRNILHRDIKPSNILIPPDAPPILVDFGIAKVLEGSTKTDPAHARSADRGQRTQTEVQHLTRTDIGIGTPEYMAPEQGRGKADRRSDIYSLAVVLYELVTGRKPFEADTPLAVLLMHITDPLPAPRKFVPDLPVEMERIIVKALAKKPEDRYKSMTVFAEVLEQRIQSYLERLRIQAAKWEKEESWNDAMSVWREVLTYAPGNSQQVEFRLVQLQGLSELNGLYQEARTAMERKAYDHAIPLLRQILARNNSYRDASILLAQSLKMRHARALKLEKEGKWEQAIKTWQQILESETGDHQVIEKNIERLKQSQELANLYNQVILALKNKDDVSAARLLKEIISRDETYKDALELLSQLTSRNSKGKRKLRRRRVWVRVGVPAAIFIILSFVLLSNPPLIASIRNSLNSWVGGGIPTPLPTSIPGPTILPGSTSSPDEEPDSIRSFAEPILAEIADRTPDYQDDFRDDSSGWLNEKMSAGNERIYSDGVYRISNWLEQMTEPGSCTGSYSASAPEFSDFVLEIDGSFLQPGTGTWSVLYRINSNVHYGVNINTDGSIYFHKNEDGVHIPLSDDSFPASFRTGFSTNKLTLIAQGSRMAVYLNGEPVAIIEDTASGFGSFMLAVCDGTPLSVLFDNIKIWDISNITSDQIHGFSDPILNAIIDLQPDYSDDFSDPTSGWRNGLVPTGPSELGYGDTGYIDGEYFLKAAYLPDDQCCLDSFPEPPLFFSDFLATLDFRFVSGDEGSECVDFRRNYGDPGRAWYSICFNTTAGFGLFRFTPSSQVTLATGWAPSFQNGPLVNHLKIIAQGSTMAFLLNDIPLEIITDDAVDSGAIVLWMRTDSSSLMEVRFDNLKIWDITGIPNGSYP